jgi:hypothetical protein
VSWQFLGQVLKGWDEKKKLHKKGGIIVFGLLNIVHLSSTI